MEQEELKKLAEDIAKDSILSTYPLTSDGAWAIAEAMNKVVGKAPAPRIVNARHVLAELGMDGAVALDKLESASITNPAVKWAVRFLAGEGLDIGHPMSQLILDQLAQAKVLSQSEADALKSLALADQTRAEALLAPWRGRLSYQDIEAARALTVEVTNAG